jgi:hypothetical protein
VDVADDDEGRRVLEGTVGHQVALWEQSGSRAYLYSHAVDPQREQAKFGCIAGHRLWALNCKAVDVFVVGCRALLCRRRRTWQRVMAASWESPVYRGGFALFSLQSGESALHLNRW